MVAIVSAFLAAGFATKIETPFVDSNGASDQIR